MNKFKVGDKVVRTGMSVGNALQGHVYEISEIFPLLSGRKGINLEWHEPDENNRFQYYSSGFDLARTLGGHTMNKFKVGDKVVRVSETYGKAIKGEVYEVSGVSDNKYCASTGINLKGHHVEGSGKFNYEESSFELYDDNILLPLEAAESLLRGDQLEVITSKKGDWQPLDKHQNSVTIKNIKRWKFRRKPKTVTINGVEVVAPAKKNDIEQYFYTVNFSENIVHTIDKMYINNNFKHYWATEEDAQKALDAMLIPFKQ